jgi:hypothetical protein
MLEENTRLYPLFKSVWQFVPVEAVPMPCEGKMGKSPGSSGSPRGLRIDQEGFLRSPK